MAPKEERLTCPFQFPVMRAPGVTQQKPPGDQCSDQSTNITWPSQSYGVPTNKISVSEYVAILRKYHLLSGDTWVLGHSFSNKRMHREVGGKLGWSLLRAGSQ